MASLPSSTSQRFNPADYKTAPDWFSGRFLTQLNLFVNPVFLALRNGLNFQGNFNAQIYSISIQAGIYTNNTIAFQSTISGVPIGVILLSKNVAGNLSTPVISPVEFSWYYNAGTIQITGISGLTPGTIYQLTWLIF
jgi:hypothetical protein